MTDAVRSLELPTDYADMLAALHDAGAEFLLIGGWAVLVHGHARATDDLDILVRPTAENAGRVFDALTAFGAPTEQHGVTAELFSVERYGYRIGRKPLLIELLTAIDGVAFDEAADGATSVDVNGLSVPVIGLRALLKNKRASGRAKDLADIEALEHAR